MKKIVSVIFVIILISASMFAYTEKSEVNQRLEIIPEFKDNTETVGNMRIDKQTKIPAALYNVNYRVDRAEPEAMARQYLSENADKLHIRKELSDIEFINSYRTTSGYRVRFVQAAAGFPLYRSCIKVSINNDDEVVFVMNSYIKLGKIKANINISQSSALQIAKNYLNITGRTVLQKTETVVYNVNLNKSVIVQKVTLIAVEDIIGEWEILVDANTGKIIRAEDKAYYSRETGSAWVYDPDPITNATTVYGADGFLDYGGADSDSLTAQLKVVALLGITEENGIYSLEGPFASVVDYSGSYQQDNSDFHYTRSESSFGAINAYYHIDHSMRYLQELMSYEIMPYQYGGGVRFNPVGLGNTANASYTPLSGQIDFGIPSYAVNGTEDQALIIHELGHGIHDWITVGGASQVEGLSEGLGDYWAQSYTRSLGYFEPGDIEYDWFGLWALQPTLGGNYMRVTNFPNHYPEGLWGQPHYDGQLWSSSLMSIYDQIGREATDKNCWEGISMTGINSNQPDAANAFMQADMDIYDGIHMQYIVPVFAERGYIDGSVNANFESDTTGGESPLSVTFTDTSFAYPDPIISWEWDFENNGVTDSYEQNPTHIYSEIGLYSVSLTVSDGSIADTKTRIDYIGVGDQVIPDFTAEPTEGIAPLTVSFTDESIGNVASWDWDFDNDGVIDSNEQDPSYIYSEIGMYSVSLTVSNASNTDTETETKVDYINVSETGADIETIPAKTKLIGNYPNPFNPTTTISFELNNENTEDTKLIIYNLKGQKVKQLFCDQLSAGKHSVVWDGKDNSGNPVSSGIYFYKMKSGIYTSAKKMILIK